METTEPVAVVFGGVRGAHHRLAKAGHRLCLVIQRKHLVADDARGPYEQLLVIEPDDGARTVLQGLQGVGVDTTEIRLSVAFHDDYHLLAADLAALVGVPYPYSTAGVRNSKHKPTARALTAKIGPRPLDHVLVTEHASTVAVAGFFDRHGQGVLKPVSGTGSRSVSIVRSPQEVTAATGPSMGEWLLEELIEGHEYSVETFSAEGIHHILDITEKRTFPGTFVESGHLFRALPDAGLDVAIRKYTREVLTALAITDGPSHTEVMVNEDGVFLIETQCRMGGDYIWKLVETGTQQILDELIVRHLLEDDFTVPPTTVTGVGVVAYRHIHEPQARVTQVRGLEEARAVPGVLTVDSMIPSNGRTSALVDSSSRSLVAVAYGTDVETATSSLQEAWKAIELDFTLAAPF